MALYRGGVRLSPEMEAAQEQEKLATGTYNRHVTATPPEPEVVEAPQQDITDEEISAGIADIGADIRAGGGEPEVPTGPTDDNAVFDGDETPTSSGNIFDGLSYENIADEISRQTDTGNELAKQLELRRGLEGTTGAQDPILKRLGFSTIEDKDPDTDEQISSESTLSIANEILKPGGEFEKLGLTRTGALDNTRLRNFFGSQGKSKNEIDAIINARDARLKEDRIKEEGEKFEEIETKRINDDIDREEERLQGQVDRNMNIAQRQRSLRGVGLSSATERDLRDIQETGDKLMSAYRTRKNAELQLSIAQRNKADGETISALREGVQKAIQNQNLMIKANADIESQLVAQGKIDSNAAFDSLMANLETADVDTEGVDKTTSELVGYLSDKFGNAIEVDGNLFPIGGTTADQADQIKTFSDAIFNGDITTSSVPTELRGQVLASLARKRESMGSLSFDESAQAAALSKEHFGNTKEDNVKAIEGMMLEGKSASEITQILEGAGFSEAYNDTMKDAFGNMAGGLSEAGREFAQSELNRRLEAGDDKSAIDILLSVAKQTEKGAVQAQMQGRLDLLNNIESISKSLDEYAKAGGDTGLIPGTYEKIVEKAGGTTDPKMATILNEIALAVQSYRKAQTGAAFSEPEAKEYRAIFPNTSNTLLLNATKIASLQNLFVRNTENFYRNKFSPSRYEELFPNGVMGSLLPGTSYDKNPTVDYSKITPDMSDEDVLKSIQSSALGGGDGNDFDIDDDEALGSYLDFSKGDQTSSSKADPLSFIRSEEGFRDEAYQDSAGVWTIGYGATKMDGKPVKQGDKITKEQGDQIFAKDVARHSNFKNLVTVPLSEQQQAALASFEFNLGANIWKTTGKDIIRDINSGNLERAIKTMLAHNKARDPDSKKLKVIKGLTNRRRREADLLRMIS